MLRKLSGIQEIMESMPNLHPFIAAIIMKLQDKEVEVYLGDSGYSLKYSEYDFNLKNIIRGKVKEGIGDCLILEVGDIKKSEVFVNSWSIKCIVPVDDPHFIKDVFTHEDGALGKRLGTK